MIYYVLFEGEHLYIDVTDDLYSGVKDWADSGVVFLSKELAEQKAAHLNNASLARSDYLGPKHHKPPFSVRRFIEAKEES